MSTTNQIEITSTDGITVTTVGTQGLAGPSAIMTRAIETNAIGSSGTGTVLVYDHANTEWTASYLATGITQKLWNLQINGAGVVATGILDEDNMASNSAVKLATQQSIKAYVDTNVTAQDLDITDGSSTIAIDLDSETLSLLGGTGVTSTASGNGVTFAIDSTVTTLTGSQTLTNKTLTSPVLNTGISGTAFLDEDNFASNSATKVASQQSIKAYVDTAITAEDLDITDGSNSGSIDLDSEVLGILGGTGLTSSLSGNNITLAIDSSVATLTGTQTLTNKTLTTPVITSISNSGTVTIPTGTETLVGRATTDTLTNKTLTSPKLNGSTAITTTGTELNVLDGNTSASSVVIADADQIIVNDGGTMKQLAVTRVDTYVSGTTATLTNKTLTSPVLNTGLSGTAFLDEDNMASNSATKAASQQSIKAYVDAQVDTADTLSEILAIGNTTSGTDLAVSANDDITFTDSSKALFGASSDLQIYHESNHSYIVDNGTGNLKILGSQIDFLGGADGAETMATMVDDGAISLYFNNSKKLETTNTGVTVTGALSGTLSGNASTATALETARTIGGTSFDGTANIAVALAATATILANARTIGGTSFDGSANIAVGLAATATALATARTIGGTSFDGTANIAVALSATATALATARTIALTGDVTATGVSFDGTGNISLSTTIAANSVALGTDTTGNYVGTVTGGTGIDSSGATSGEGIAHTLSLDLNELTTETTIADADFIAMVDATDDASGKITFENLEDAIFSSVSGDITISESGVAAIAANSVALSTDTTGNYIAGISGTTNEVEVSGSGSEGATATIGLPDNVTIAGNFTVNGTTTTVNTATLSVEDPLIKLANQNSGADSVDIGFYGLYDTSGSQDLYAGLFRDANDSGKFKLFKDLQAEPTTTVNTGGTGYAGGTLVATFEGNITGNVTGNASGTAATVTGAAQTAITSVGTLTALTVDDVAINGKVITMTGSASDTAVLTAGTNGTLSIVTTDAAAAAANIQITADGTVDIDSAGVLTLDSGAAINIEPASGSAILLDGTISIDAGVVTGATSITSTALVGALTGNASTATILETSRNINGVAFNGSANITLDTDDIGEGSSNLYYTAERTSDLVGTMVTGNTETGIAVTYQDGDNTLDFVIDAAQTAITSIYATDLIMGEDSQTAIDFGTANEIDFKVDNAARLTLTSGALYPVTNNQIDLGTASLEFKDAFFDGTVTADAFAGSFTGSISGNAATATALETARTIGGTSFDGTANISVALAATATALATARTIGGTSFDGTGNIAVALSTEATNVTVSANNLTNETVYPTFVDGATGTQGVETDTGLTYNPSTGMLTATGFTGALTGNSSTATTLATARTIGGTSFDGSANIAVALAATSTILATARTIGGTSFDGSANIVPATITVADTTDTSSYVALFESATGNLAPKTDAAITYNAGTGALTSTSFVGALTGNVTGNTSGLAGTATALATARTIGGTSFDGTANIAVALSATTTALATARTIGGTSFDGTANIAVGLAATATALATARTIGGTSFDGTGNIAVALATDATTLATARTIGGVSFDGSANIVPTTFAAASFSGAVTAATSAKITQVALTSSSAAVAWDAAAAANAYHVTTENTTFSAPSNPVEGAIISVELAQGGTARTIAWNTVFEFAASTAPTVTATASKTDIFSFRYNGSVWQEIGRVQNLAQT